jgi:hypothetical protein
MYPRLPVTNTRMYPFLHFLQSATIGGKSTSSEIAGRSQGSD